MEARQTPELSVKFLDSLQNDLKNLSIETKKKFPQIKEVSCNILLFSNQSNIHIL